MKKPGSYPMTAAAAVAASVLSGGTLVGILASCATQGEPTVGPLVDGDAATDAPTVVPGPDAAALQQCTDGRWCAVTSPAGSPYSFNGIWGSGPSDVWIAGSPDLAIHWDGSTFTSATLGTDQTIFGVWGSGPKDVWAFSTGDAFWHNETGDPRVSSWAASDRDAGTTTDWSAAVHAMWGRNATDVWAVGKSSFGLAQTTVWHSDGWNGGAPRWTPTTTTPGAMPWDTEPTFNAVWGTPSGEIWVVGDGGKTRYSSGWENGAATWAVVDSGTSLPLYALWGTEKEVWAVGAFGTVRRFTRDAEGKVTTEDVAFPNHSTLRSLLGFAGNDIWAGGSDGTLAHWDGATWTLVDVAVDDTRLTEIFALWASSPADIWAVGRNIFLHKGTTLLPGTLTP